MSSEGYAQRQPDKKDPFTVLFVDPEEPLREVTPDLLQPRLLGLGAPYSRRVLTAESGEQALDIIKREPIHMVIADEHLQGIDGVELFDRLRAEDHVASKRFVLMTSKGQDLTAAHKFMRDGGVAYCLKPDWAYLEQVVNIMEEVHLRRSRDTGGRSPGSVLVLDDNDSYRHLLGEWLTMAGFNVLKASNRQEARNIILQKRVAVGVVDRNLKEDNSQAEGIEWVKETRRFAPFIDFILNTANGTQEDVESTVVRENFAAFTIKDPLRLGVLGSTLVDKVKVVYEANKERRAASIRSGQGSICYLIGPRAAGKTMAINYARMLPFILHVYKHCDRPPRFREIQLPELSDKKFKRPGYFDDPSNRRNYLFIYKHPDGYNVGVPREPILRAKADDKIALISFGTKESFEEMLACKEAQAIARHETYVMLAPPETLVKRDKERGIGQANGSVSQKPYSIEAAAADYLYFSQVARKENARVIYSIDPDPRLSGEEQRYMQSNVAAQLVGYLCNKRLGVNTPAPSFVPSMPSAAQGHTASPQGPPPPQG